MWFPVLHVYTLSSVLQDMRILFVFILQDIDPDSNENELIASMSDEENGHVFQVTRPHFGSCSYNLNDGYIILDIEWFAEC